MMTRYIPIVRSLLLVLLLLVTSMMMNGCGAKQNRSKLTSADEALESINHLARATFEKGKYKQAAGMYQRVLDMAYIRNDSTVILDTRYNLAICLMELERYPEAIKLMDQVRGEFSIRDGQMPPDFLLLDATIFYRNDQLDDSWVVTENILALNVSLSPLIRTKTHYLRGLIYSRRDNVAGIRESIDNINQPGSMMVTADQIELQGRLAMADNNWNQAIIDFDQATHLRRQDCDYRRMAITLALSAAASEKAGEIEAAAGKYLQAGRSAVLRENQANARTWLNQAALLFERIGNDVLATESHSFLETIGEESPPVDITQ